MNSRETSYLAGVLHARGHVINERGRYGISFQTSDEEKAKVFIELAHALGKRPVTIKRGKSIKIFVYSKDLIHVRERVSDEKAFLQGFFDFGSTIYFRLRIHKNGKRQRCYAIRSSKKDFSILRKVKEMLSKLGINSHIYRSGRTFTLEIYGKHNFTQFYVKVGSKLESRRKLMEKLLGIHAQ